MGVFNAFRGRDNDAHIARAALDHKTANATGADITQTAASSDSDNLSLEARNEKEAQLNPDAVTADAELGVKKAEAAAIVWSKKAVIATYCW